MTDREVVKQDIQELYLGNLGTVEFDLNLPLLGKHGSQITWSSNMPHICDEKGKVTRPAYGKGNREVLLTAVFQYGEYREETSVKVTVLQESNSIEVVEIYPIQKKSFVGETIYLPGAVAVKTRDGRIIAHGVTWEEGDFRLFEEPGHYQIQGRLLDTQIQVCCMITVRQVAEQPGEIDGGSQLESEHAKRSGDAIGRDTAGDSKSQGWKVRLSVGSDFYDAQERMHQWLIGTDTDQWLYNFRKAAGLDVGNAAPMTGWDSPDGLLRGHSTGHYLSSLALCYHATGDEKILEKAHAMEEGLAECQKAFGEMEGFHKGFLSAYSEEQFDLLERYTPYPTIWAPYYTLHKILAGLLDLYRFTGSKRAAEIAVGISDWIYERLKMLSREQRTKMWSIYIAGEYGGMNEALAEVYRMTGEKKYLETAEFFDNDRLFFPLEQGVDALDGMHANQHIPQIVGAAKLYTLTGEKRYLQIARHFWENVTHGHIYATGGTGEGEMFHQPGRIAGLLTGNTQESCATYNMLKLTSILYSVEQRAEYMDFYERALFNHILSSCDHDATGGSTYFLSMRPAAVKEFDVDGNSCCHGTGLESHFKYGENIYFLNEENIYVNLFISSQLEWEEEGTQIKMQVDVSNPGELTLHVQAPGRCMLKIRKPGWVGKSHGDVRHESIFILDGRSIEAALEDGYYCIDENWTGGRTLRITVPCGLYCQEAPDDEEQFVVCFGPYVLAAVTDGEEQLKLHRERVTEDFERDPSGDLVFRSREVGCIFKPIARIWREKYQVYMKSF